MKNILFIIPHPDDEIVGSCTIIKRLIKDGKKIFLFFVTNGVISEKSMWFWRKKLIKKMIHIRKKEMKQCMELLDINDFFFQNIPTRTLKENIFETYTKIKKIINSKKIDTIFCPAYEGGHQDHDISNFICSRFLDLCEIFEFPEYNFFNRKINCNTFIDKNNFEKVIKLNSQEIIFKKKCMDTYRSERRNLNYIRIESEAYRVIKKYDYSKPPHVGVLFYRRFSFFSWHPRVDNDDPNLICKKIIKSKIYE